MESAKPKKIKPIASLDALASDTSDIRKATQPLMPPVSMAVSIATAEETSHFVNEGGLPSAPAQSMGNSEVTTGIPTAPVAPVAPVRPTISFSSVVPQSTEDIKFGKAFLIAKSTHKSFKVGTIDEFISVVEEIKNNL